MKYGEKILEREFWRERMERAVTEFQEPHRTLYECSIDHWMAIASHHTKLLSRIVRSTDSILDTGCAWGRLLHLLPPHWQGDYLGVDLNPDFIRMARQRHPNRVFIEGDLRKIATYCTKAYDIAVLISIRSMILRELGTDTWAQIRKQLGKVARWIVYLEYDTEDTGCIEQGLG
jgi:hypothetical protein